MSFFVPSPQDIADALNRYIPTKDGTDITTQTRAFGEIMVMTEGLVPVCWTPKLVAAMAVQAYVGRYFLGAGERLELSTATGVIEPRDKFSDLRETPMQSMLVVSIVTLSYILVLSATQSSMLVQTIGRQPP